MSKPCRVVCAGLIRSGSTWQYNAARFLLWPMHGGESYVSDYVHYDWDHPAPVHFIKEHQFRRDLADRGDAILTSLRPTDEVRRSWRRYMGTPITRSDLVGHLDHVRNWLPVAHSVLNFADLIRDEDASIEILAHDLQRVLGPSSVERDLFHVKQQLHAIPYPAAGEPPHEVALYRWNHRTSL